MCCIDGVLGVFSYITRVCVGQSWCCWTVVLLPALWTFYSAPPYPPANYRLFTPGFTFGFEPPPHTFWRHTVDFCCDLRRNTLRTTCLPHYTHPPHHPAPTTQLHTHPPPTYRTRRDAHPTHCLTWDCVTCLLGGPAHHTGPTTHLPHTCTHTTFALHFVHFTPCHFSCSFVPMHTRLCTRLHRFWYSQVPTTHLTLPTTHLPFPPTCLYHTTPPPLYLPTTLKLPASPT